MVGCVMLCGVGSMFLVDSSLVQLFVSRNLSVLTTYVYSCHTSLTVMPSSVYVNAAYLLPHNCASHALAVIVRSDACLVYY